MFVTQIGPVGTRFHTRWHCALFYTFKRHNLSLLFNLRRSWIGFQNRIHRGDNKASRITIPYRCSDSHEYLVLHGPDQLAMALPARKRSTSFCAGVIKYLTFEKPCCFNRVSKPVAPRKCDPSAQSFSRIRPHWLSCSAYQIVTTPEPASFSMTTPPTRCRSHRFANSEQGFSHSVTAQFVTSLNAITILLLRFACGHLSA